MLSYPPEFFLVSFRDGLALFVGSFAQDVDDGLGRTNLLNFLRHGESSEIDWAEFWFPCERRTSISH